MILWTFRFTDREVFAGKVGADGQPVAYETARVCAPSRDIAIMIMGAKLNIPIAQVRSIICAPAGMDYTQKFPAVLQLRRIDGQIEGIVRE